MRRWLLNIFAALSLLLMVGVVTLWVRSYWRADAVAVRAPTRSAYSHSISFESGAGLIRFCTCKTHFDHQPSLLYGTGSFDIETIEVRDVDDWQRTMTSNYHPRGRFGFHSDAAIFKFPHSTQWLR